ncbi:MAG: TerB family tellurite resistance protein [Gammaproteobacteria bacterium]
MRHYDENSAQATARILAMAMLVDGHLDPAELKVVDNPKATREFGIDMPMFRQVLEDLCYDMLHTAVRQGAVELNSALLDSVLSDITDPELRRRLLNALWRIADADGYLADAEAIFLARACALWSVQGGFCSDTAGASLH